MIISTLFTTKPNYVCCCLSLYGWLFLLKLQLISFVTFKLYLFTYWFLETVLLCETLFFLYALLDLLYIYISIYNYILNRKNGYCYSCCGFSSCRPSSCSVGEFLGPLYSWSECPPTVFYLLSHRFSFSFSFFLLENISKKHFPVNFQEKEHEQWSDRKDIILNT